MVSITTIEEDCFAPRFINRNRLNEIKKRIEKIPFDSIVNENEIIFALLPNNIKIQLANITYPGISDVITNLKRDLEDLVRHVENADEENDRLLIKIDQLTK